MKYLLIFLFVGLLQKPTITWKKIDIGLYITEYKSPKLSSYKYGDNIITIFKVNPKYYNFNLIHNPLGKPADVWGKENKLIAVMNAGMFDQYRMNLGLMKHYENYYNTKMNTDNTVLAMNPKDKTQPLVQIIDVKLQDWDNLSDKYNSYTQSIRMMDKNGRNVWSKSNKMWSMVVVAIDKDNNALFIHTRTPYDVHDFINILKEAPLNIVNMMYLEGGPEASMYVSHNGTTVRCIGSYETSYNENNNNNHFWDIPNVIGITKK